MKLVSVADRIRSGLINPLELRNMRKFAQSENMLLHSIPLKDGTAAKILANSIECDCLIMKNGKVLTAKGGFGTADDITAGIMNIFEHINKRKRAAKGVNVDLESFGFLNRYLNNYEKFMTDI
jgi:hypothetical protein